jgi:hypothetical protein
MNPLGKSILKRNAFKDPIVFSTKGAEHTSIGQSPGGLVLSIQSPEGATQIMYRCVDSPPQGWENLEMRSPRALPWAGMVQAFGLEERLSTTFTNP